MQIFEGFHVGVRIRIKKDVPIEKRTWRKFSIREEQEGIIVGIADKKAFVAWDNFPKPTEVFPRMKKSYFNFYIDGWQIDLDCLEVVP